MIKLFWTKEALTRLQNIEEYISLDNKRNAEKFIDNLISKAESIPQNPERGRVVPELKNKNIREIIYNNYRIVYVIKKNSIDVLTVFEGHKKLNTK